MNKTIKEAFVSSIPIMLGYLVLGAAFGLLLQSKGYSIIYPILMSIFIYAGSMQFVTINLLVSGASLINVALMTLVINARHLVYGLSMINKYKDMGKLKPYMIFSLTDETYSLLVGSKPSDECNEKYYYFFISLFDQCYWVLGSIIGYLIGSVITFDTTGLDFSMTALFVVIVLEQFLTTNKHIYTYIGFIVSIVCLLIFGADSFIIPSMIGIIFGLIALYKRGDNYA